MKFLTLLAVVAAIAVVAHAGHYQLRRHAEQFDFSTSDGSGPVALDVMYNDTMEQNGWVSLRISQPKNSQFSWKSDYELWYAAGLAEGKLSQLRSWQLWVNSMNPYNVSDWQLPTNVSWWVDTHMAWIDEQVYRYNTTDRYWRTVGLILAQLEGLSDGYSSVAPADQPLSYRDMFLLNFQADLGDVMRKYQQQDATLFKSIRKGGCSAFIKPTSDDLFMAHTTWGPWNTMLRMYKDYDFAPVRVAFSSYPTFLQSSDDWYQLSTGLAVQETTDSMFAVENFKFVIPQSVPEWIRVMVANNLAIDGLSWVQNFARYNSGTYNNEYMVVNMNLFVPGTAQSALPDGLLWITDQMPGMCPHLDVTYVLRQQGYFASFNIPFLPEVYVEAGYEMMRQQQYGSFLSRTKYARAEIFALRAPNVQTLEDAMHLIRYNEWQTDPLSRCPEWVGCKPGSNPQLSISNRGDLVPINGTWGNWTTYLGGPVAFGGMDGKIASYKMMMQSNFDAIIVSGPTWETQKPFQWSTSPVLQLPLTQSSHIGQADLQKFDWLTAHQLFNY